MEELLPPPGDHPGAAENGPGRLTGIRDAYTLASTPEAGSETDKLMIYHFLTTLAEIALSVASRNLQDKPEGGT